MHAPEKNWAISVGEFHQERKGFIPNVTMNSDIYLGRQVSICLVQRVHIVITGCAYVCARLCERQGDAPVSYHPRSFDMQ